MELITGDDEVERFIRKNTIQMKLVDNFIKSEREIRKTLEPGIKPIDILGGWSAGWLAPNGDYYALNGEISNMLHNQIADALVVAKIIPIKDKDNDIRENPDRWLETNGWVKIHKDWILYDGWNLANYGGRSVPMTEIQKDKIYRYGQVCCNGILTLGFKREQISAARFGMTEIPMLKRYFDL
jgi:hypothetical protein